MERRLRLRALWSSLLKGIYLTALVVALAAFGLHACQAVDAVRAGDVTPADAVSDLIAWFRGEENVQADACTQK